MGSPSIVTLEARLTPKAEASVDPAILKLQEDAEKLGYKVAPISKPINVVDQVREILRSQRDGLGYFVAVDGDSSEDSIELQDIGESGKCYYMTTDLNRFIQEVAKLDLVLDGVFYRAGVYQQGDVERFIVRNNKIESTVKAKVIFPDGEEFIG